MALGAWMWVGVLFMNWAVYSKTSLQRPPHGAAKSGLVMQVVS